MLSDQMLARAEIRFDPNTRYRTSFRDVAEVKYYIRIVRKGAVINLVALEKARAPFPVMRGETQGECPL